MNLAVDVGGSSIKFAVIDENNNTLKVLSNNANKNILEELGRIIEHMEKQKDFKVERSYLDDIVVRNYERANN